MALVGHHLFEVVCCCFHCHDLRENHQCLLYCVTSSSMSIVSLFALGTEMTCAMEHKSSRNVVASLVTARDGGQATTVPRVPGPPCLAGPMCLPVSHLYLLLSACAGKLGPVFSPVVSHRALAGSRTEPDLESWSRTLTRPGPALNRHLTGS